MYPDGGENHEKKLADKTTRLRASGNGTGDNTPLEGGWDTFNME